MLNSEKEGKSIEVDNIIRLHSDDGRARFMCLGCGGEEATNHKRKEYIEELEKLLSNQVLKCEEEAYKLYCEYAYAVGFSVRKGKQYYFPGTRKIRAKWYCCSKEGFGYDSNDGNTMPCNKLETRTGCKAMIYFICNGEGQWKASKFVKEHNHEMAELHERQFLRSARAVLASNNGEREPMVPEILCPGFEVESSEDAIYIDSDEEEEVLCLCCNGGEEATMSMGSSTFDVDELERKLLEQVVHGEEEAYKVYCDYAHIMGFSVRKGKQYYFPGSKRIRTKSYCCSKEGSVNEDISVTTHNKLRTGCKAMICFTCDDDGLWKVSKFVKEHNHKMAELHERHLLRSAKSVLDGHFLISARPVLDAKGNNALRPMMLDLNKSIGKVESSGGKSVAHGDPILEPQVGTVFESEDAAKAFYKEYARQVGFVVCSMSCCQLEVDGKIIVCEPGCSKEGCCASKGNELGSAGNQQPSSGAGCRAMILLKSGKPGEWFVMKFLRDHSHPLVIFPKEVGYSIDEKDRKIQELKAQLQDKRRLCTLYQELLFRVAAVVEDHTKELSKRVECVVNNIKGI